MRVDTLGMPAGKNLNAQTAEDGYFKGRATETKGRPFHSFIDGNKEDINNSKQKDVPVLAISIDHEVIMGQGDSFEVLSKSDNSNTPPKEQSAMFKCCGGGCCG